jgi:hypothetical protein
VLADLGAEGTGQGNETGGGEVIEFALGQNAFHFVEAAHEAFEFLAVGGANLLMEGVEEERSFIVDLGLEFVLPEDEGALGDMEFLGEAGQAQALGAEFDELGFGGEGVHLS